MIETKLLRIPKELKDKMEEISQELGISLNALILNVLWETVKNNDCNKRNE